MADSSSESQQSFDIDTIPEDSRQHIRQVLAKGKQIVPFYSDSVLYKIFRSYYQNDQVFYNQLRIISKRNKQSEAEEGGWVTIGKDKKAKTRASKYNFLEDKQLIWRATNWDKQEAKNRGGRNNKPRFQKQTYENQRQEQKPKYRESNENGAERQYKKKESNKYREKQRDNENINNNASEAKRLKYAEKTENKSKVNAITDAGRSNEVQKKQKKQQRIQNQKINKQEKTQPKTSAPVTATATITATTTTTTKPSSNSTNNGSTIVEKKKYAQKKQSTQQQKTTNKQEPKKATTQQQTKKVESKPAQVKKQEKQQKVEMSKQAPKVVSQVSQSSTQSIKTEKVQQLPPAQAPSHVATNLSAGQINKNFEQSCKKYPKILKFIKPTDKMSKVSFVWNNGHPEQVKVVVPLH